MRSKLCLCLILVFSTSVIACELNDYPCMEKAAAEKAKKDLVQLKSEQRGKPESISQQFNDVNENGARLRCNYYAGDIASKNSFNDYRIEDYRVVDNNLISCTVVIVTPNYLGGNDEKTFVIHGNFNNTVYKVDE